jgi:hypothetical protein
MPKPKQDVVAAMGATKVIFLLSRNSLGLSEVVLPHLQHFLNRLVVVRSLIWRGLEHWRRGGRTRFGGGGGD